jgi:hypothetical protein
VALVPRLEESLALVVKMCQTQLDGLRLGLDLD